VESNHGVEHELSDLCLAQVEGSKTVQAFLRDDLLERRRPVMQQHGGLSRRECPD